MCERDSLQARVTELEEANAAVEEENDLLRDVIQQKHARIEELSENLERCEDLVADAIRGRDQLQAENELLYRETRQLNEALGMARAEYGNKNLEDLNEYDRLRLTANAFKAMNGVLELQANRNKARIEELEHDAELLERVGNRLVQQRRRVEVLTAALTDALELAGYTGVRGKEHAAKYRNAYAVLAEGGDLVPLREERDQLQARITELEADIAHREDEKWFHLHFQGLYSQALRAMARRAALLRRAEAQTARRRVTTLQENKKLRAALTEIADSKFASIGMLQSHARAALAAGETESETR